MEDKPHKAPRKSLRDHTGRDADVFFFATIAIFFGVPGAFAGVGCVFMLVAGIIGANIGSDVTPFGASLMMAIAAVPSLGIGAIAWAIARRSREDKPLSTLSIGPQTRGPMRVSLQRLSPQSHSSPHLASNT